MPDAARASIVRFPWAKTTHSPRQDCRRLRGSRKRELPDRIFRYVDVEDPVPLLPTVSLAANTYCHCRNEIPLQGPNAQSFV